MGGELGKHEAQQIKRNHNDNAQDQGQMVRDTDKAMYSGTVKRKETQKQVGRCRGRHECSRTSHRIASKTQKIAACFSGKEPGGWDQG